jgi:hypothetical protein
LTLKDDLDPSPLKMCSSMRYTCISNIKLLASILQKWHYMSNFDPYIWPWRMTLTFHHSKCAAPWDTHACQISSCYLQYCKSIHKISDLGHIYLTSDLEGWPWPFTTQNVQLHEIHMHAKYQVAIFNIAKVFIKWAILATYIWPLTLKDDLDLSPLKMCSFMRYTCMPNMKLLSSI